MTDAHDPPKETTRDAIALTRAVLLADEQGAEAILNTTRCNVCLCVATATLAILLAATDQDMRPGEPGEVILRKQFVTALDKRLAGILRASLMDEP